MTDLPEAYSRRMRRMLGDEWNAYEDTLGQEPVQSVRYNLRKWTAEEADRWFRDGRTPVPWVPAGRYVPREIRPAKDPAYFAGLYYIQEASAMTPGEILPLKPGGRVLDLCAAPGGKSTQLAGRMQGGVLYANDISASRAQALLKNLEMAGMPSLFVTAEDPARLAEQFPAYFDSILVDAPCSGEGMTRRDASMWRDWLERGPAYYQPLQAGILDQAAAMAAPGAWLLYSTCTFSEEENEGNIRSFLERHPDFSLENISRDLPGREGFAEGTLPGTVRLWPHKVRGEGHFLALLRRQGGAERSGGRSPEAGRVRGGKKARGRDQDRSWQAFRPRTDFPWERYLTVEQRDRWYAIPGGETIRPGLHYLRTGLLLGEEKGAAGFVPSQALAMALRREQFAETVSFPAEDDRAVRYLKGETVDAADQPGPDGWTLVCLDRFPLGWAVRFGSRLKNKYQTGWRWM